MHDPRLLCLHDPREAGCARMTLGWVCLHDPKRDVPACPQAAVVRDAHKEYVHATALPKDLVQREAKLGSEAYAVREAGGV